MAIIGRGALRLNPETSVLAGDLVRRGAGAAVELDAALDTGAARDQGAVNNGVVADPAVAADDAVADDGAGADPGLGPDNGRLDGGAIPDVNPVADDGRAGHRTGVADPAGASDQHL